MTAIPGITKRTESSLSQRNERTDLFRSLSRIKLKGVDFCVAFRTKSANRAVFLRGEGNLSRMSQHSPERALRL